MTFYNHSSLFGTIASRGFGVNIHRFLNKRWNLVGEKLWNKRNNQTRMATKKKKRLRLSLCTVTNAHHHCYELFCLIRIFLCLFLFFCQNQTCCLSRVCCTCDSGGRGNRRTKNKDASSANRSRPGGHDWKRIHMTTSSTALFHLSFSFFFFLFFNFQASSIIIIVKDTREWPRPVAICKAVRSCGWKIGL